LLARIKQRFFQKKIIQFGPIRSGSTLVYNYLKELFPKYHVVKTHQISAAECNKNKVVVTVRNPLDCLASSIIRHDLNPNEIDLSKHIEEFRKHGLNDLMTIFNHPNVLLLRYEDFRKDSNIIVNELEQYFNTSFDNKQIEQVIENLRIEKVEKLVSKIKEFGTYDKKNLFHGKHVSQFKGEAGYYKKVFNKERIDFLNKEFKPELEKLGYASIKS